MRKRKVKGIHFFGMALVVFLTLNFTSIASAATEGMFAGQTGSNYADNVSLELGSKFKADAAGTITAVKVYGVTGESGNHSVRIWNNSTGAAVAGPYTWNFTGSNSWVTYTLPTALNISANVEYTVAVSTGTDSSKHYTAKSAALASAGNNGSHLSWTANAGVFTTSMGTRPTTTYNSNNYLRDVVFEPSSSPTPTPLIFQEFNPGWSSGGTSQDGIWQISGIWTGTGGNTLDPANVSFTSSYSGESSSGFMNLKSEANALNGSEVRTFPSKYKYGYYEVRMKTTGVGDPANNKGVVNSFFLWDDTNGNFELDFEFLTNGSWINSTNSGQVTLNYHLPDGTGVVHTENLDFNPKDDFHRYGFLWQPGRVDWTIDGEIVYTVNNAQFTNDNEVYMMVNSWTGNPFWGGLAPATDAIATYDWVKFYPNVTTVIP